MSWIFHKPNFISDDVNFEMLNYSPWAGHRNFAYDYVANMRPATIVELGTHYGTSFFAFLQAIEDGHSPKTALYGVDLWGEVEGNDWTKKEYEIDIYEIFLKTLETYKTEAKPIRKIFDDALTDFKDQSIDLLHIDGTHTYEAVKNDYEKWSPKVKEDGIILFHDISETSFLHENASPQFWNELKASHYTLEFDHCYGLGILCKSPAIYEKLKLIDFSHYQRINNLLDVQNRDQLRKNYFRLKDNDSYISFLMDQCSNRDIELDNYKNTVKGKDAYITQIKQQLERVHIKLEQEVLRSSCREEGSSKYISDLEEKLDAKGRKVAIGSRAGLQFRNIFRALRRQHP